MRDFYYHTKKLVLLGIGKTKWLVRYNNPENLYSPDNRTSKYIKQQLTQLQVEIFKKSKTIMKVLKTFLSKTNILSRWENSKIIYLNSIILTRLFWRMDRWVDG